MLVVNIESVRHLVRSNMLMTAFKIGIIILIAITLLSVNFYTQNFYLYEGFPPLRWHGIVNAVAMGGGLALLLLGSVMASN